MLGRLSRTFVGVPSGVEGLHEIADLWLPLDSDVSLAEVSDRQLQLTSEVTDVHGVTICSEVTLRPTTR